MIKDNKKLKEAFVVALKEYYGEEMSRRIKKEIKDKKKAK